MRMVYDCIPCLLKQMNNVMRVIGMDDERAKAAIRDLLRHFLQADLDETPPDLSRGAWAIISRHAGTDDPYAEMKAHFNREMLAIYPDMLDMIRRSDDPDREAIKLTIVGNIIDFGAVQDIDREGVMAAIERVEHESLVVDHSAQLFGALGHVGTLLYLGDNCGEIAFDKALIAYLRERFPRLDVFYAVRGQPILNDVTREDAEMVGMAEVATVVDNGDGAPGTVLTAVSPEFRALFCAADVVIGKGQGNFESLSAVDRDDVYLLFMAKCEVVAAVVGVEPMSLVCLKANAQQGHWSA